MAGLACPLLWVAQGEAERPLQDTGNWRASSTTAHGITGDLAIANEKIYLGLTGFPLAQIRALQPAEVAALFNAEGKAGAGNLYRVSIPGDKRFLHRNTLCGSEDTQWVVTSVTGHNLQVAFFSGAAMPILTPEAIATTTNLCGTFSYVK